MLTVEDWAEIRRLYRAEGILVKAIARAMGISRNAVRAALASDGPPKYQRAAAGSAVDAFEPRIRELLQAYPTMSATVVAERIGWDDAEGPGAGPAAGLPGAGPGEPDGRSNLAARAEPGRPGAGTRPRPPGTLTARVNLAKAYQAVNRAE